MIDQNLNGGLKGVFQGREQKSFEQFQEEYQIKANVIARSSYATTYETCEKETGRQLACKVVSKQKLLKAFREAKSKVLTVQYFKQVIIHHISILQQVSHSNIIKFKFSLETPNNFLLMFQSCSGGDLETALRKFGYIKQQYALPMMYQIAKGCQYLYEKDIFHMDINTKNILIGKNEVIKLSDFSFAKIIMDLELRTNPKNGTSVGNPIYMCPQILLNQGYSIKCDVWSCGVVFYRMLYNSYPWQETNNIKQLAQRMCKQITFPSNIKVSEWVKDLIRGMLTVEEFPRLNMLEVTDIINKNCQNVKNHH